MILKRILPVIAAIAVLCCMMIVPASAASFGSATAVPGRVPFADLEVLTIYTDKDGQLWSSSFSQPDRLYSNAQTSLDSCYDDTSSWDLHYEYLLSGSILSNNLSYLYSKGIWRTSFLFDDFVVPVSELISTDLFHVDVPANCSVSYQFTMTGVSASGTPFSRDYSADVDVYSTDTVFSPFMDSEVGDELHNDDGMPLSSSVLISGLAVYVVYDNSVTSLSYSVCYPSSESFGTLEDFIYDNGLIFGGVDNIVDGSVILQGFSSFITDGVGAFLSTPMFGDFSLGALLAGVVSVLFALIIIKMFAH